MRANCFENEENYWPIRLMKSIARLPHEYETWIGPGHTIPNGDPPAPYADNTPFSCALILYPVSVSEEFHKLKLEDGRTIRFYCILPLYPEETDLKLARGTDELLQRFDKHDVRDIIGLQRPNSCRKKRFGLF